MDPMPQDPPQPAAFIPPTPDRTARPPRAMPRMEDLPVPAQNELRAMRGETPPAQAEHPEKRRMGLLQRLASVGLGRKEEAPGETTEVQPNPRPALRPLQPQQRAPEQRAPEPRPMPARPVPATRPAESRHEPVSEYAKRPAHQGLDPHGRQAPVHNSPEEDQLEIPAFLRRQAT
jgi:cell division protein FtsZ